MKISTRLSIIISLTSSAILIVFGVFLYFFVSFHQARNFEDRLKKRLAITEKIFLDKESFTTREYEKLKMQFLPLLPNETEEVIEIKKGQIPEFIHNYPKELKQQLLNERNFSFWNEEWQGVSKIIQVGTVDYLIIVTAVDKVGSQTLNFLMSRIILLILLGIPLIFVVSFELTKRYLQPISKKIQHANMIGASNLSERLKVINPHDEIGEMAIAFNKMLERLEISFEAKKLFISNASHEIRNPLTAIMGEAEVAISKTRSAHEYQESLNKILEEADTLNSTVNNLLLLSKIAGNEAGVSSETIHFDAYLIEIGKGYNYLNSNNEIAINIEKGPFIIKGNKNLLKTAIVNLLDNACKYSSNKLVKIKLYRKDKYLVLSIKDKGIGISKEELAKIFEPFYRGSNTRNVKGTGIGLSLCGKIIQIHKGTIDIQSQLGKGTQVYLRLPLES